MHTIARIAMSDISEYLKSQNIQIYDNNCDVWIVTPSRIYNKEVRNLNKKLGLHKINKFGDKMNRFSKSNSNTQVYKNDSL